MIRVFIGLAMNRLLNRLRQEAAVPLYIRARNEATGLRAGQENGRANEFVRFAEPAHGSMANGRLSAGGWRAVRIEQQTTVLLCGEETRRDRIDAHAFSSPFPRQKLREA